MLIVFSYKYMLILALDANFRLSNLRRLSSADPGLHTGLAYFSSLPEYHTWLAKHPVQTDVSIFSFSDTGLTKVHIRLVLAVASRH